LSAKCRGDSFTQQRIEITAASSHANDHTVRAGNAVKNDVLPYRKPAYTWPEIVTSALYFNDVVSVGWVCGGFIELASQDPRQGVIFYTLDASMLDVALDTLRIGRPSKPLMQTVRRRAAVFLLALMTVL